MPKFKGFIYIQLSIVLSFAFGSTSIAREPVITENPVFSDTLMEFSLSGQKAKDGRDGRSYRGQTAANGTYSGEDGNDGRHGQDGERVSRAQHALPGRLLVESGAAGLLTFSGTFVGTNGRTIQAQLKDTGFFRAVSRGGNGAMPGFGGWGENAGDGARGYDGVGNQRGGDGGDGGYGGDAGAGHDGGKAGDGKEVRLGIRADHLELAWVLEGISRGGIGGTHSEHGRPGEGGSGGPGGSGGTYYETVHETVTTTDSEGNQTTETVSREVMRQAPDGSYGSSGSNGRAQTRTLYDGEDGKDDKVIWEVLDADGNILSETENLFSLQLVGFNIKDNSGEFNDGIFEPGEEGYITNLFVKNNGGMVTPSGAKTRLRVKKGAYFYSDDVYFDVPEGLKPGEIRQIKGEDGQALKIPIKVKDFRLRRPKYEPFVRSERIVPVGYADVAEVERQVPEFNLLPEGKRDFTVQFPILIEPVNTLPNLARGEASRFIFRVTNISGRDFGSESELKRHLEVYIKRFSGDIPIDGIEFFDKDRNPLNINEGILKSVSNLKANESIIMETIVGVSPATDSYRSMSTSVELNIDRNGYTEGEDLNTVQRRVMTLNVSDDYFKTAESDFLLVTNHRLTRSGYEAWKRSAERMKTSLDIWDISHKHFIRFMETLGEYNDRNNERSAYDEFRTSIGEDFRGKTIILMGNNFNPEDGDGDSESDQKNIWDYINLRDLRAACAIFDINLYILENDRPNELSDIYSPRRMKGTDIHYSTFSELRDHVTFGELDPVKAEAIDESRYWETGIGATLSSWRFFLQPWPSLAKRRAWHLYHDAVRTNPDADHVVIQRFDPSRTAPLGFSFTLFGKEIRPFGSRWKVGEIELWRSMGSEMGNVVVQKLPEWDIIGPEFVDSQQNIANMYLTKDFSELLRDFENYLSQYDTLTEDQKDVVPVLIKAIEKQLVLEQVKLRHRLKLMPNDSAFLADRLKNLKALSNLNFSFDSSIPPEIINLVSDSLLNVYEYSKGQRKWWERFLLVNGTKNSKIARDSSKLLGEVFKDFYSNMMDKKEVKGHFNAILKRKQEALKAERGSDESWARLTLRNIDIDDLIDQIPSYRGVMAGEDFDQMQARLSGNDRARDETSESMIEQREQLLVPNPMFDQLNMGSRPLTCRDLLR